MFNLKELLLRFLSSNRMYDEFYLIGMANDDEITILKSYCQVFKEVVIPGGKGFIWLSWSLGPVMPPVTSRFLGEFAILL